MVLDNCIGSGTTAVAAVNTGRHFIGIELNDDYYAVAVRRAQEAMKRERTKTRLSDF